MDGLLSVEGIEDALLQFSLVEQASRTLGLRPVLVPVIAIGLLLLLLGQFEELILAGVGFFYPAWQSYKAIEGGSTASSRQWLAYWVVYASFSIVELFSDVLLFWIPFYYLAKLGFLLWLSLPQFQGATFIYDRFLQPFLARHQPTIERAVQRAVHR